MEIFRRVYCGEKYEGVYQLVFNERYQWKYILETICDEDRFDYPKLNLEQDRNSTKLTAVSYMLNLTIDFKEEDLEESYETIKTIKD